MTEMRDGCGECEDDTADEKFEFKENEDIKACAKVVPS
jgi:hypothetical protein